MTVFKNTKFTTRKHDAVNIVACKAESAPTRDYVACDPSILESLSMLWRTGNVTYFGYR